MDTGLLYLANRNCVDGDGKCTVCGKTATSKHFKRHIDRGGLTRGNIGTFKYIAPPAPPPPGLIQPAEITAALGLDAYATSGEIADAIDELKAGLENAQEAERIATAALEASGQGGD